MMERMFTELTFAGLLGAAMCHILYWAPMMNKPQSLLGQGRSRLVGEDTKGMCRPSYFSEIGFC